MKKYSVVLIAILLVLQLSACSDFMPRPSESPTTSTSASPSGTPDVSPSAAPSPVASDADKFLSTQPTAAEISAYLKQNATDLPPQDADLLLERLVLAQLDVALDMNNKIWDDAYMTTLNQTLGGVLDASKIPNIVNNVVRRDFKNVADSTMTMVRYEETPVFEPDWAALQLTKSIFGTEAGTMIEYQSRLQGRYYYGDPYNFDLLAADIVAVEQLIQKKSSGFVKWQLEHVYTVQVGRLLYGPEGSYISMFISGDKQIVSNITKYAEQYPESSFGILCGKLLKLRTEGDQAVYNCISDSQIFPLGDARGKTELNMDFSGAKLKLPQLTGMADASVMERVNAAIVSSGKALVESVGTNKTVNCYISYVNDNYINLSYSYTYTTDAASDHYSESYLLLDLKTGTALSLDDLVGGQLESYKSLLVQAMHGETKLSDIKQPVNFVLGSSEMLIYVSTGLSEWPDYYTVTFNGLQTFMDITKLY